MDFSSFLTSLGTSFVIFVVLMLVFTWLSRKPRNDVIYYPNKVLKGLNPSHRTRNPVSWIREAMSSTEEDIIRVSGVDTAVYFVYLSTALAMLVLAGIVILPVLLPISATDHSLSWNVSNLSNLSMSELDQFSMGHVGQHSSRLWAFLVAVYWVSLITYILLWKAYKHVSDIRGNALMSPEVRAEQFAVLVRDIPAPRDGESRKDQVDSYFKAIYPDTFYKSLVVTDNKRVNKIWEELEGYRKKLVRAETIYDESKTVNPEGVRPTNRVGFLGLCGEKVDTIEYCNEKISELVPKLEAEQKVTLRDRQISSALVFFSNRVTAASAAQNLHARMVDHWTVEEAPEPRQLIWGNLSLNYYTREVRKYAVYTIVALAVFFFMIPIGIISAFTTLQNLKKLMPFIEPVVKIAAVRAVLEAYLPQLVLIIFLAMLPKLLMFLSKVEGIPSESHVVRSTSGKYFYFIVLNVFIGVTLGGTLYGNFKDMQKDPKKIPDILGRSLPKNASFFLTFVALKIFVGYGLELSRLVPLIIFNLQKKYLCKTEADVKEAWAPGDFGYTTKFPADMLILTISLCYSVIAPLIIPFAAVYFLLGWLVMRNQALNVYIPSYESYGRMWPHIHQRFLAALVLYQITMLGYFGVKEFYYTPIIFPLPVLSFIFAFVCHKKYYHFFQHTALEVVAFQDTKATPDYDCVYRPYLLPSLSFGKADAEHCEEI